MIPKSLKERMAEATSIMGAIEKSIIEEALETHATKLQAAESLGISPRCLYNKIRKYGISLEESLPIAG